MNVEEKLQNLFIFKLYTKIFRWTAKERLEAQDLDPGVIHTHLLTVATTGILMWGYAIVAHLYINSPVPTIVGYACAIIHLLSPLLLKISNNKYFISGVLLSTGVVHQATFSYYSGGFNSDVLIWFGIIPMLAGLIAGRYSVIFWSIIVFSITSVFLYLELHPNFQFPNTISAEGRLISHAMIAFGWIFLSLITVYFYILIRDITVERLESSSNKVNTLLRVLCHDLANLLQVVILYSSIAEKAEDVEKKNLSLSKIGKAASGMDDVIQNVKQIYTLDTLENQLELSPVSIRDTLEYACMILEDKLRDKKIEVVKEIPSELDILVEETSFKHQVVLNILTNAIKFSPKESKIIARAKNIENETIQVEFQDFGIGMPEDIKKGIFDPAIVSTRKGTSGEKGTGFGMSIMNSFVEKYGGSVQVESEEGKGTKFIMLFKNANG
jgi:signal transduction histidine kinase